MAVKSCSTFNIYTRVMGVCVVNCLEFEYAYFDRFKLSIYSCIMLHFNSLMKFISYVQQHIRLA